MPRQESPHTARSGNGSLTRGSRGLRLERIRDAHRPEVEEDGGSQVRVSAVGDASEACPNLFSVGEDHRPEPGRQERKCYAFTFLPRLPFVFPLSAETDRSECRYHLFPFALVEPDHVPQSRATRLSEHARWRADAQQDDLRPAPSGADGRRVSSVYCSRVRICRQREFVRERMVSADRRRQHPRPEYHGSAEGKVAISPGRARTGRGREAVLRPPFRVSESLTRLCRGRLVREKASGQPKLTCRNWECGVVVPVVREDSAEGNDRQVRDDDRLATFEGCVPVPMHTPGAAYVDMSSDGPNGGPGSSVQVQLRPWCLG